MTTHSGILPWKVPQDQQHPEHRAVAKPNADAPQPQLAADVRRQKRQRCQATRSQTLERRWWRR